MANTIELVLSSFHQNLQHKRQIDQFSRFCTADGRKSLYFTMGARLIYDSLASPSPWPKRHHHRLSRFCTDDRRVSLYFTMGRPFPQNCHFQWGDQDPHLGHSSLGQSESSVQMASRLVQPFLQAHYCVRPTDRQTDHATRSVTN